MVQNYQQKKKERKKGGRGRGGCMRRNKESTIYSNSKYPDLINFKENKTVKRKKRNNKRGGRNRNSQKKKKQQQIGQRRTNHTQTQRERERYLHKVIILVMFFVRFIKQQILILSL